MQRVLSSLKIDWWITGSVIFLMTVSVLTMASFENISGDSYFIRQAIWALISLAILFFTASIDVSFLKIHFRWY